jgi:hypothetical protein
MPRHCTGDRSVTVAGDQYTRRPDPSLMNGRAGFKCFAGDVSARYSNDDAKSSCYKSHRNLAKCPGFGGRLRNRQDLRRVTVWVSRFADPYERSNFRTSLIVQFLPAVRRVSGEATGMCRLASTSIILQACGPAPNLGTRDAQVGFVSRTFLETKQTIGINCVKRHRDAGRVRDPDNSHAVRNYARRTVRHVRRHA